MATTALTRVGTRDRFEHRLSRGFGHWILPAFTFLAVCYLLLPIAVMFAFSFNRVDQSFGDGKFNFEWHAFSLSAWQHPIDWPGLPTSIATSLWVAILSTVGATILGTLIGLALTRYQFRGRSGINSLIFLPMATPEVVMGASLLTVFIGTATVSPFRELVPTGVFYPLGFVTILIAHITFNISYVVVTIKARLAGFDRRLEEAAMDLGANQWTTFWKVTFPLIFPGIMAAAVLAFSLSIDDFVITSFVSGTTNTFPIWVYSVQKNALPPQINVVGSLIFLISVGLVVLTTVWQRRRS
jgi:spermidine/putrescine transport system permease protein